MTPVRKRFSEGFTLVELMVTMALVAILMTVAAPSFQAFKRSSELRSAANTFVGVLATARGEAMKRGTKTIVAPYDGSNWANGWVAFVDKDPFGPVYDPAKDEVIIQNLEPLPSYLTMTKNSAGALQFEGSGYSNHQAATLAIARNDVTGTELLAQTRRIKISLAGRVRICTPKSPTDSQCEP